MSQFSVSIIRDSGIELGSPGLAASTFTHCAISLVQYNCFTEHNGLTEGSSILFSIQPFMISCITRLLGNLCILVGEGESNVI